MRGMSDPPAPIRTAPLALWRIAASFLDLLYNLFGTPAHLAEQHTLTRRAYAILIPWLRAGEALMRRLLIIEASAYPKPNTRALLRPQRKRVRKLRYYQAETPETWRVSFRVFTDRAPSPPGPRRAPPSAHIPRFHSAWPLAERYEALLRVFNNPAPYAQRLAARLHATPHRLAPALRAPPGAEYLVGPDDFEELARAAGACPAFSNSS